MDLLSDSIRSEIEASGPMRFSRFMERCLYDPDWGYYERDSARGRTGRTGDFYTSVSVGRLFGELLAFDFARRLETLPSGGPLGILEAGAHDGRLADDILSWTARERPELTRRLTYWILEPSPRRRAWQQERLKGFAGAVRWLSDWDGLAPGSFAGIVHCNELLDAIPFDVAQWNGTRRAWVERCVDWSDGAFVWDVGERALNGGRGAPDIPDALGALMPTGFRVELRPAAAAWWANAADRLAAGWIVAFDYGATAEELLAPHRREGTLRAYRDHKMCADALGTPGRQDITAHVNWTELIQAGERRGLQTERFEAQGRFLMRAAVAHMKDGGALAGGALRQLQSLTHPQHLGRSFQTLIQARAVT